MIGTFWIWLNCAVYILVTTPTTGTPSSSRIPSSTGSGAVDATPTALTIIQAIYAAIDITTKAKSYIQQGPYLVVNMSNSDTSPWGSPDPWYGVNKCLDLLHSYGSSIRTFVACHYDGALTLVPGNVSLSPHTQEITRLGPSSPDFAIVSVVWGAAEIRDGAVYQAASEYKVNGSAVPFENWFFGTDTLYGVPKSGVIWYTEDNFLTFKSLYAREGSSVPF
jgi:hypothetical protein